jgi:peptide chain release factor 1
MFDKLAAFEERLSVLNRMLSDPEVLASSRVADLSREHHTVTQVVDAWRAHKQLESELADARELAQDEDPDLREMARAEVHALDEQIEVSARDLQLLLLPKDPYEGRPILLEIRAGTGGDEAALFAGDLYRMYQRFGERRGLAFGVLSTSLITVGGGSGKTLQGLKEIILSVSGPEAYSLLRFESGVHRVQRVPATESQGRIHTSAATVAVMPEPDEVEIHIDEKDLEIHRMRAGGPGGQSVNTTDSAVRIVHLPTGITVQCQDEKSQLKNKAKAMRVLKARLLEAEAAARHAEEAAERRSQVGSGDRSERIRTYNFPQNRLTDHRINLTLYKLDQIMEGDLDDLVGHLSADYQTKLLAAHGG